MAGGIIWTDREAQLMKTVYFNNKKITKVYWNNNFIANFPIGNLTMYLQWRYSDEEEGSGCDRSTYYFPDDLKLYIFTNNYSSLNKYTFKWEIAYQSSDCYTITKTSGEAALTSGSIINTTLTGNKEWSDGDGGYIDVRFNIKIYDDANNLIATLNSGIISVDVTSDWSNTYIYNNEEITAN